MTENIITVDLGLGDQGKGSIVDFLAREYKAETVIRYTGANQAVHNIVEPGGRHHKCSQFGSGIFAGANTHLSAHMLINLLHLEVEAEVLETNSIQDPYSMLSIDSNCRLITPFQIHMNQMREIARGKNRHGSCGLGVGEAVRDGRNGVGIILQDIFYPDELRKKLDYLWRYKIDQAEPLIADGADEKITNIFNKLSTRNYVELLATAYEKMFVDHRLNIRKTADVMRDTLGPVIFEGAQGVLLDEKYGFAPYNTYSCTTPQNAKEIIGLSQAKIIGILRAYATRHGNGPFVTENKRLSSLIPDLHNSSNEWQGKFRIGWFDLVTTKYALEVSGKIDSLAITCVDRLSGLNQVKIVTAYEYCGDKINKISKVQKEVKSFLAYIEEKTSIPVSIASFGPTHEDKVWM